MPKISPFRSFRAFVLGCAFLPLIGCVLAPKDTAFGTSTETKFDQRLLAECKDLPKLKSSKEEDVKPWIDTVANQYGECRELKRKQNAETKKALKIK
jgi:hypothetical protein